MRYTNAPGTPFLAATLAPPKDKTQVKNVNVKTLIPLQLSPEATLGTAESSVVCFWTTGWVPVRSWCDDIGKFLGAHAVDAPKNTIDTMAFYNREPHLLKSGLASYSAARFSASARPSVWIRNRSPDRSGGYLRFCQNTPMHYHTMANQLRIMNWIYDRRIEMLAEGRPHWVPTERDFWQAMRDSWDDLVEGI